jgi:hypothetical protein
MVSIGSAYQSQASDMDGLLEEFFQTSQEMAYHYFEAKIDKAEKILNCYQNDTHCDSLTLTVEDQADVQHIQFSKGQFLQYLNEQYKAYRAYAGIANYNALNLSLRMGNHRHGSVAPLPGLARVRYTRSDDEGRNEIDQIQSMYEAEIRGIRLHNRWINQRNQMLSGEELQITSHDDLIKNYKGRLAQITSQLPFFGWITSRTITERHLKGALRNLIRTYNRTINKINRLEGDDRYELLGFVDVFQQSMAEFDDDEALRLVEHFRAEDRAPTLLEKILAIVSNKQMWAMVGCWSVAIIVPVAAAIVGTVCGAISLYLAAPGAADLVSDTLRMIDFGRTGAYESDLFTRYMVNHAISFTMYSVFFAGAVPGLHTSVKNFRRDLHASTVVFSMGANRMLQMGRDDLVKNVTDELKLLWGYSYFYGRDVGLESISDLMLRQGGIQSIVIPAAAHTLLTIIEENRSRGYETIMFSQILQIQRTIDESR